jgi:hypothetical protein
MWSAFRNEAGSQRKKVPMSEATDAIMSAIRSAFDSYPKEGDPEWRSPNWIMPEDMRAFDQCDTTRIGSSGLPDREEAKLIPPLPSCSRR